MHPLRRHQLAIPSTAGWRDILAADWDDELRDALVHWAAHGLPLVVTRQRVPRRHATAPVSLGLCLPERWRRRLVALQLPWHRIALFSEFPTLAQALCELPRTDHPALRTAAAELGARGLRARVYGSVGWQCLTGLRYVHERSDLDLWVAVDGEREADEAAAVLDRCMAPTLRVDGELVFTDGMATAWREWRHWRAGRCSSLLVKRLDGADLLQRVPPVADQRALACAA
ncbi:MAG: malonate decarboxylase holo-[acyl-carrier-protein] synthase [Burkholderiaceae bacterium]|nr:malonate decarboxylase holo-[acyl-carrier-protein] synthase [Burkholderiaceae bacterium]